MISKNEKTRARQRVAIAKDAMAWEKAGALEIITQHYLQSSETGSSFTIPPEDHDKQARDLVLGKCQVCALGGLLLAKAVRFDAVTGLDIRNCKVSRLTDHFSNEQINEIEAAFEGKSYPGVTGCYPSDSIGPVSNSFWKEKYPNDSARFRAIMQNIISNKGTFCPDKV
jgi:hypothetical protein